MKIDLKDGFCVSCDRESGVLYQCCPYCGERVWHPLWRRVIRVYILLILPLILAAAVLINSASLKPLWEAGRKGTWVWQSLIGLSAALLLMPRCDRTLILTSSKGHAMWLLNSLAASVLLLLCAVAGAAALHMNSGSAALAWQLTASVAGAVLIPFVLNCGWWRVALAGVIALALLVA